MKNKKNPLVVHSSQMSATVTFKSDGKNYLGKFCKNGPHCLPYQQGTDNGEAFRKYEQKLPI